jgi:addiction module HigA family antidote
MVKAGLPKGILAASKDGSWIGPGCRMRFRALSRQISVPPNRISQIIQGKRAITGDTALRLGHWFQTSAQFWLNLQSAYDLRVASDQIGREVAALPTKLTKRRAGA